MIAPHILVISVFLSITWGIYLVAAVRDYRESRVTRGGVVALRRVIVSIALFTLPFSFLFRTACVLLGVGDEWVAQVTFFSIVGINVLGSIFAVVSLKYD